MMVSHVSKTFQIRIQRELKRTFKEKGLIITVACNLAINDFLDVTFYLKSCTIATESRTRRYSIYISNRIIHHL